MALNVRPIPTSTDDLEAQINSEFSGDGDGPETKPDGGAYVPPREPEYMPPDTETAEVYARNLRGRLNPILEGRGIRPLSNEEAEDLAAAAADVVSHVSAPEFINKISPFKLSLLTLAYVATLTAAPRILESRMRDVTPAPEPEPEPDSPPEPEKKGNPIYGR